MNTLAIISLAIAITVVMAGSLWIALKLRQGAAASVEAEHATKDLEQARAAGAVMAEHRDDGDTLERLRNGRF